MPRVLDPTRIAHSLAGKVEQERLRERWFGSDEGLIHFAWEAVKTKDEHDGELKPIPREFYLEDHLRNFLREDVYFILKSRQILITWTTFIALTWACLKRKYCTAALVPKKDEDGEHHIEDRIRNTIWPSLPAWLRSDFDMAMTKGLFHLKHRKSQGRWDSWITSFAKGTDQLRQYTHSYIFWDEMAFQEYARQTWRAAIPTVGSRKGLAGRVICNSTFGEDSFHDTLMGDPPLVDRAVAIALGEEKADERLSHVNAIVSPGVGIAHYRNAKYGAFCAVYSFLADSQKRSIQWERREALRFGGVDSPDWLNDYRMRRGANKGVVVYPHFDTRWNIVPVRPVNRECEISVSIDFGHTAPTSILFWEWDAKRRKATIFDEIYASGQPVATFKAMVAARLALHLNLAPDDVVFDEILGDNIGDPEDPGTMLEYAQEPNPLVLRGNPPKDGAGGAWRINDRRLGEYRLDSSFRPGFICCGQRQYPVEGETEGVCQVVATFADGVPKTCGRKYPLTPMIEIMDGRAPNLVRQVPKQVRVSVTDPSLQVPEKSKKIEDHSVDAARIWVMRYPNFLAVESEAEPVPAVLRLPKDKLTSNQRFWREYHEAFERNAAMHLDKDVGEIGYHDDDDMDEGIDAIGDDDGRY